ncbi:MAG: hypothetical protein CL878_14170 [Dehalococcoidia bacterium]|nr:hypothetical protein [Dehalococcoidia bacterium]
MSTAIATRPLGRTGEQATVVGLGGAGLPRQSFADGVATVHRALELGVTYFDTSPVYGEGLSQAILGVALEGRTEPYLLATKLGHLATPARFRSVDSLRTQLEENLRLLRPKQVAVLQVHEADYHHWWSDDTGYRGRLQPDTEYAFATAPVMQVLLEEKARGRCRFIGITGNTSEPLARILRDVEVDTCLAAFNYDAIQRGTRRHVLPAARAQGVAVILGGVFENGRLATRHPEWRRTPPPSMSAEMHRLVLRLYALQEESGLSLVSLILRYLVADPAPATILVGARKPAEIEESVAAVQAGPLPPDLHRAVENLALP